MSKAIMFVLVVMISACGTAGSIETLAAKSQFGQTGRITVLPPLHGFVEELVPITMPNGRKAYFSASTLYGERVGINERRASLISDSSDDHEELVCRAEPTDAWYSADRFETNWIQRTIGNSICVNPAFVCPIENIIIWHLETSPRTVRPSVISTANGYCWEVRSFNL